MRELREDLIDYFNSDSLSVTRPGLLGNNINKIELRRTDKFNLELEVEALGASGSEDPDVPAGTFSRLNEHSELSGMSNAIYTLSSLVQISRSTSWSLEGEKTKCIYAVQSVERRIPSFEKTDYVIEWVGNLSSRLFGNSTLQTEDVEQSEYVFGEGESSIKIERGTKSRGISRILHIITCIGDVYLVSRKNNDYQKQIRAGYLVYKGTTTEVDREKIRNCISFVLGLPIVMFGFTEYTSNGSVLYMKSVPMNAFGEKVFYLFDLPPYPVGSGAYRNDPDIDAIMFAVNRLYENYDDLKFDELYWTYWHGACATVTMAAVYYGGLCEQLQRIIRSVSRSDDGSLVHKDTWRPVEKDLLAVIDGLELDPVVKKIMRNKICSVNQLPQNIALERLLTRLGLSISNIERDAWRHRNSAAHGGIRGGVEHAILNNKLLKLMFHRLLAAITYCSHSHVDYYSLDFPIRMIPDEIPPRNFD